MKKENKKLLNLSIEKIILTVIVMVFTGVLGLIGATAMGIANDVEELKSWRVSTEIKDQHVIEALESLKSEFEEYTKETSAKMGMMDGDRRRMEGWISKLEGIIEEMRRH